MIQARACRVEIAGRLLRLTSPEYDFSFIFDVAAAREVACLLIRAADDVEGHAAIEEAK